MTPVAPLVFFDDTSALKGSRAINMFVRDMPRLSVDLDLVFYCQRCDGSCTTVQQLRKANPPKFAEQSAALALLLS